jgi:hypothetical protein
MYVLVMMFSRCAMILAQRILQTARIVQHFVNDTLVKKGFEGTIDGHPVIRFGDFFFDI